MLLMQLVISGIVQGCIYGLIALGSPRAMAVTCSDDELQVSLTDGSWLSIPVVWFPRLARASPAARANYELMGEGEGIHWPEIDEDITVAGLLSGQPSGEYRGVYA